MSDWLVDLLGDDYAILLDKPRRSDNKIFYSTRCIHYNHNNKHYDENPSGWIEVLLPNGWLKSGCYACGKAQIVYHGQISAHPDLAHAIPQPFKVEVEWQEAICFVSDDKNYIVLDANGDIVSVKGGKWRGRDKEAYLTKAIPEFVRLWATQGKDAAMDYAKRVLDEIRSGRGWDWIVRTHRVGKGDVFLLEAGYNIGDIATYAYKDKKHKVIATKESDGYDCDYYAKEFSKLLDEVMKVISDCR